ncbi:WG repeat-containing protein [Caproiciproducens faecalis]|uniref:WG repeat-containing protein n=1 Tax=Caproiciproducens faecalis TaxID=2820301 RepID=A0ABS7DKW0_9FIRM|nr:WG repeat-containing protein [Caproiciproducens faecalis]MBW7571945.1 WG repeat-containing protein [Caproiciproducens faecalis]
MKKCSIYNVFGKKVEGVLSGNRIYPSSEDELFYDLLEPFLLPVESGGKWGLMDGHSGALRVSLRFDFIGLFVYGACHAVKDGLHGYLGARGEAVLPFEYEDVGDESSPDGYFAVKRGKWGVVNKNNVPVVPFVYDRIFLDSCVDRNIGWLTPYSGVTAIKDDRYVLLDSSYQVLTDNLTAYPRGYEDYLLLQNGRKFGVACRDGRLITDVTLLKREAMNLIKKLGRAC